MKIFEFASFFLTLLIFASANLDIRAEESNELVSLEKSLAGKNDKMKAKTSCKISGYIDNFFRQFIEKVKQNLAEKEPYSIPEWPINEIDDPNVQIKISLIGVKENKASELIVNYIRNNILFRTVEFNVTFPELELQGNYIVHGKVLDRTVHGNGIFKIWIKKLNSWGTAHAKILGSVQVKKLDIGYHMSEIKAKAAGLVVEDFSEDEVRKLLDAALLRYFINYERIVSDTISQIITERVNYFLKDKSIIQLIVWLKNYITSTE